MVCNCVSMLCAGLALGFFYLAYTIFIKPFSFWKNAGVTQYSLRKQWIEMLNSTLSFRPLCETVKIMYDFCPDKRYFGVYYFGQTLLMLRDPELIKQITVKDFDHFSDHKDFMPADSEWIWQKNLFVLKGDSWRDMRATLSPSFTTSKLKTMFGLMCDSVNQFVDHFEKQNFSTMSLEIKDAFQRLTNDVIATTAFGITCNSMEYPNNQFYMMGKDITSFSGVWLNIKVMLMLLLPNWASKGLGLKLFNVKTVEFFTKLIKENIEAREKHGIVRSDMINLLLETKKNRDVHVEEETEKDTKFAALTDEPTLKTGKSRRQLTDEDILAQAMLFFFAGFETVSTVMSFLAYELALNPDIQEKVFAEINATLRKSELSYESLANMKYFDMVVSETIRKYAVGFVFDHVCVKPYTIRAKREGEQDIHFKVGDAVWIPVVGLHGDPKYFPNPERFDPERFSDVNKDAIIPYTYLPFGPGPRHCIGFRFALMEMKLAYFHLLLKFELVVVDKTPIPMKFAKSQFRMGAEGGFWVGLKTRTQREKL